MYVQPEVTTLAWGLASRHQIQCKLPAAAQIKAGGLYTLARTVASRCLGKTIHDAIIINDPAQPYFVSIVPCGRSKSSATLGAALTTQRFSLVWGSGMIDFVVAVFAKPRVQH